MLLLACPDCSRQYDVTGLPPESRVRCVCEGMMTVGWPRKLTAAALTCTHCGGAISVKDEICPYCQARISESDRRQTTLCPACLTRIEDVAKHCRSCALEISPQALTPLPADRDCPRCEGKLQVRALGVADVIECGECLGMWLTPEIFEKVCRGSERETSGTGLPGGQGNRPTPRKIEAVKYIPCLTCNELMQRRQYLYGGRASGVVVDQCGQHGVWLDHGELEQIVQFIGTSGQRGPSAHFASPAPSSSASTRSALTAGSRPGRGLGQHWLTGALAAIGSAIFG